MIHADLQAGKAEATLPKSSPARFVSLDVFRGITVAGMILVNTPGSSQYVYAPLRHARWDGCTPADLVFPFFLFAVGNALSFSMPKYENLGSRTVLQKIMTRALLIFGIGLLLNWFPFVRWHENELVFIQPHGLRIFGVLQRIAIAYAGAALIVHFFNTARVIMVASVLLILYWIVLTTFGDLSLEGNVVSKVDRWLIGEAHLYKRYFSDTLNQHIPFDPEGLLSTMPAIASVVFGYLAGKYIRSEGNPFRMLVHLLVTGMLITFAGQCWDLVFPINKPIWSSAYVLYTTGLAIMILGIIIFFADVKGYQRWTTPFVLFGKNPLFIFVLSVMLAKIYSLIRINGETVHSLLYKTIFQPLAGNYPGSLLFALAHVGLFMAIGWWLDKRQIYIKV